MSAGLPAGTFNRYRLSNENSTVTGWVRSCGRFESRKKLNRYRLSFFSDVSAL